jgi:CheY-like chemotaxis protein/nitrogen-specific signal transduction histidine kinase
MMAMAVEITEIVAAREERQRLVEELEAANQAKDEFLALLGHELRNPLAPITTALDLIAARGSDPAAREHAIIARQAIHLTRLVDDLIDVARIVRGKVELQREVVTLASVVEKAIETALPVIERRNHALAVHGGGEPIRWYGDPIRLSQVIANLLTNAARYTNPGGSIDLFVTRSENAVEIRVVDTGIGIGADLLPRVFDRFVQGSNPTQGGLGIGLTLVKSLVELHGGTVTAASAGANAGSTFTVTLPLEDTRATDRVVGRVVGPSVGRGESKRVLVVDDNVDAALMMAEMLRAKGHIVDVAHDGPSALAKIAERAPAVALLDIGLPVMSGYELAARVRELYGAAIRLIALTGYGRDRDRDAARDAGFELHLVKPVPFAVLLREIESH